MDAQLMVRAAIVLLALTASVGLLMAGIRFAGQPYPRKLFPVLHGVFAVSAMVLLVAAGFAGRLPPTVWVGILALLGAAIGGLVLNLGYHWRRRSLPIWLMLVHAGTAATGFTLVAVAGWNL